MYYYKKAAKANLLVYIFLKLVNLKKKLNIKEWKNSTCWLVLVFVVELWFSVLLKFRSYIITHPRGTNDGAPSNLQIWMEL